MFERFDRPVRCSRGHVFTTIWIPLASVKALRLLGRRYQHCPVGKHWALVEPMDERNATQSELEAASGVHDWRVP